MKNLIHHLNLIKRNIKYLKNLGPSERSRIFQIIKTKYESPGYRSREMRLGYEPRVPLYDVILEYAEVYGKPSRYELSENFREIQYDIDGKWLISIMFGQGSVIHLQEIPKDTIIPHIQDLEESVTFYYPDGREIITTSDPYTKKDVISQIKGQGFYYMPQGSTIKIPVRPLSPPKIPKILEWGGTQYTYARSKHDILLYTLDGSYHYDDWVEEPEAIVVQYRRNLAPRDAFLVLHHVTSTRSFCMDATDISRYSKLARPVYDS